MFVFTAALSIYSRLIHQWENIELDSQQIRINDSNFVINVKYFRLLRPDKITREIGRASVRETGISRYHGGPIMDVLKPLDHHGSMRKSLRGALDGGPLFR